MKVARFLLLAACLSWVGCNKADESVTESTDSGPRPGSQGSALPGETGSASSSSSGTSSSGTSTTVGSSTGSATVENGVVKIDAGNSTIRFVGTHAGAKPDPRTGQFGDFAGTIKLDANNAPQSIDVEFKTESISTEIGDQLTTHLKSADFFDVREYPTASFKSKSIAKNSAEDTYDVTGDLTLHGVTKEVTFPVVSKVVDNNLNLTGTLTIKRLDYNMTFGADRVVDEVTITVAVGTPTVPFAAPAGGFGGRGGRRGGPGAGGFDPQAIFKNADKDSDGKLAGDEIQGPMKDNLANIDTDGDGAVSLEEFQKAMANLRRGGAGGPPAGGPPAGAPGTNAPAANGDNGAKPESDAAGDNTDSAAPPSDTSSDNDSN